LAKSDSCARTTTFVSKLPKLPNYSFVVYLTKSCANIIILLSTWRNLVPISLSLYFVVYLTKYYANDKFCQVNDDFFYHYLRGILGFVGGLGAWYGGLYSNFQLIFAVLLVICALCVFFILLLCYLSRGRYKNKICYSVFKKYPLLK
jgi:hypothetical protein